MLADGTQVEMIDLLDLLVLAEIALGDAYGLTSLAGKAPVIVDVGAGFGAFSIPAGKRFPDGQVVAAEPNARSYAALERNLARNGLTNVSARRTAVGCAGAYRVAARGRAALTRVAPAATGSGTVPGTPLEALLPPGVVDLLKIDCEGSELDVLRSASTETLARVRRVELEYHVEPTPLVRLLEENGFRVRREPDRFEQLNGYLRAERR